MGRIYALDSCVLIEALSNRNGACLARLKEFGQHVVETKSLIVIPAPVLAEYLQGPPPGLGTWNIAQARHDVKHLLKAAMVADVTEAAANRCAEMARGPSATKARTSMERSLRDRGASRAAARQMVKMDWLIMATAETAGASVIFTNEAEAGRWSQFTAGILRNLSVEDWARMPHPSGAPQRPHSPRSQASQGTLFPSGG